MPQGHLVYGSVRGFGYRAPLWVQAAEGYRMVRPLPNLSVVAVSNAKARRMPDGTFLIGRQPVFDTDLVLWGYELLFRGPAGSAVDGESMTADVLLRAGMDIGLHNIAGDRRVLVNATRPFVLGEIGIPLPPERTVVEVLEDVAHDTEVLDGIKRLQANGYLVALDDYVWEDGDESMLRVVDLVKLDVLALGEGLVEQFDRVSQYCSNILAEKVETNEELELCKQMGFHLFQGYLLSRPQILSGRTLSPSRAVSLKLIAQLCSGDVETKDVEATIESCPALSIRFLRAAGVGASAGLRRPISSIREGVVLLGLRRMRAWASIMVLEDSGGVWPGQLEAALTRARLCELLAEIAYPKGSASAFTLGMLSSMDVLMQATKEQVLETVAVTDELASAMLNFEGPLGGILADAVAWEEGSPLHMRSGVGIDKLNAACATALAWTNEVVGALAKS